MRIALILRLILRLIPRLILGLVLATLIAGPAAWAQADPRASTPDQRLEVWENAAAAVEGDLENAELNSEAIGFLRRSLETQRAEARALADRMKAELEPLDLQIEALGAPPPEPSLETVEVRQTRERLSQERAQVDGRLRAAELAVARAETLIQALIDRQRMNLTDRLFGRGPSLFAWETWRRAAFGVGQASAALWSQVVGVAGAMLASERLTQLVIGLGAIASFWVLGARRLRRVAARIIAAAKAATQPALAMAYALALVLLRAGPPAASAYAVVALIGASANPGAGAMAGLWLIAHTVAAVVLVWSFARILFAPDAPEQRIMPLTDHEASLGVRRAVGLALLATLGALLIEGASQTEAPPELLAVLSALSAAIAAPLVYALSGSLSPKPHAAEPEVAAGGEPEEDDFDLRRSLSTIGRVFGAALAVAIPLAALFDYFALARFLLERGALTMALLAGFGLLFVMALRLLYGGADAEARASGQTDQGRTGSAAAGLGVALAGLALTLIAGPVLFYIWGASIDELRLAARTLIEGVRVGEVEFSFGVVIQAVAVLVAGLWLTRVVQRILRRNVLPSTRLDKGAQTSIAAAAGYLGVFLTSFAAVSTVGLDLSNLAIVAGALSVGIGFGLQNVVNNFVSGLILLVERPVQVGDWIIVGGAEGYVRRINVRSTEIETFDRASVIVPNSELISSQVTNWTHKSLTGRVICKVGVAYSSDVELVTRLLKGIANGHSMALRYPAPVVLFRGFGDSALEFELRLFIRDVNWVLSVHSELNYEIFRQFREAGVEIPFPQRDLHLISTPRTAAKSTNGVAAESSLDRPPSDLAKGEGEGAPEGDGR
ncbi:MAG: mechanosensitive ion channel domain-containing protein [Pseudomonadota bacterium]